MSAFTAAPGKSWSRALEAGGHAVEVGGLYVGHVVLARAVQAHQIGRKVLTVAHL